MSSLRPEVKKLYYSISEVSEITKLKAYVLRYWETEFNQLSPPKNRAGNRTYRQKDIEIILKIKELIIICQRYIQLSTRQGEEQ